MLSGQATRLEKSCDVGIEAAADYIARTQRNSGEIPWFDGGKTDPWDHVEAAMGLSIGGYVRQAHRAFEWMANTQLEDGSWYCSYRNGLPEDKTRDANMSAYIAVGVYHLFLITRDKAFSKRMWDTIRKAIDFASGLQAPGGEIYWAVNPEGKTDKMALLTGSSSVCMSLKCALALGRELGCDMPPEWETSLRKLEDAIRHRPHVFNMSKARFSMDWFYPILCGAVTGESARKRIDKYWKKFIMEGQGVRCVSDQPWVTLAETSELCLALAAMGNRVQSEIVFDWISDKRYEDGSFWCGHTYPDMVVWPEEKNTWTNAVVLMAADAIYGLTPASQLFSHKFRNGK
jgi:hypothetical protein